MPRFQVEDGGRKYEVEAPSMEAAVQALSKVPKAQEAPAQAPQEAYRGAILPLSRDTEGNVSLAVPGMIKGAWDTLSNAGQALRTGDTSPQGVESAIALGALGTPMSVARGTGQGIAAARGMGPRAPAPTQEALRAAAKAGYDQARNMGVDYDPAAVARVAGSLRQELESDGFLPILAPKSFRVLEMLERPPAAPEGGRTLISLSGVDAARKALRKAAGDFNNPTDQAAAQRAIEAIDRFTENPDPASVVAGPAAAAGRLQADARGNYAALKRSQKLTTEEQAADLNAATANSGQNIDNALRQRAKFIVDPRYPKRRAGFSKEEIAAIESVARGTRGGNALRYVGNLLGGGGGLGQYLVTAGGAGGGAALMASGRPLLGATAMAAPLVGMAAKRAGNNSTRKAFNAADELVRMRSPLYGTMAMPLGPPPAMLPPTLLRSMMPMALPQMQNDPNGW